MDNSVDWFELTADEQLEFNRRRDVAHSIVPAAAHLFIEQEALEGRRSECISAAKSPWYWVVFVGACIASFLFESDTKSFTWLSWLAVIAICMWGAKHYESSKISAKLAALLEKLRDLETTWSGAVGERTLFELRTLTSDGYFDDQSDSYREWWFKQTNLIVRRVCSIERGAQIVKHREEAHERFASAMQSFKELDSEQGCI